MRNALTLIVILTLSPLFGCDRSESVSVYTAPKDPPESSAAVMQVADTNAPPPREGVAPPPAVQAQQEEAPVKWTVPAGWKSMPAGEMRFAVFLVNETPPVQLTVIPLGAEAGNVQANVNRWEQQLDLPPTPAEKLDSVVKKVNANGLEVAEVDLNNKGNRMLAAMSMIGGRVWFFKMSGPTDVIAKQKENFDSFIKSLTPTGAGGAAANAGAPNPSGETPPLPSGHPALPQQGSGQQLPSGHPPLNQGNQPAGPLPSGHPNVPEVGPAAGAPAPAPAGPSMKLTKYAKGEDWKELPASKPPRMVAFDAGSGDQKAQVIVTRFGANNAGTFLDNVNRWRQQLGLPPVANVKEVPMRDVNAGKEVGVGIEIDNPDAKKKMLVGIASVGPDLWFFKMTGPSATVDKERGAFDTFMKSLEFAPDTSAVEDEKP